MGPPESLASLDYKNVTYSQHFYYVFLVRFRHRLSRAQVNQTESCDSGFIFCERYNEYCELRVSYAGCFVIGWTIHYKSCKNALQIIFVHRKIAVFGNIHCFSRNFQFCYTKIWFLIFFPLNLVLLTLRYHQLDLRKTSSPDLVRPTGPSYR